MVRPGHVAAVAEALLGAALLHGVRDVDVQMLETLPTYVLPTPAPHAILA